MKVNYIVCVILYYLFGYLFLPDSICATPGYLLGAFVIPFVFSFVKKRFVHRKDYHTDNSGNEKASTPEMDLDENAENLTEDPGHHEQLIVPGFEDATISNSTLLEPHDRISHFIQANPSANSRGEDISVYDPRSASRQTSKSQQKKWTSGFKKKGDSHSPIYDRDFEFRLIRARTEPLRIVEYLDTDHSLAIVINENNSHTYKVGEFSCECMDYEKRRKPCKHMIFLALQTNRFQHYEINSAARVHSGENEDGEFVPLYWNYYMGYPTGLGYTNLHRYQIEGRIYGTSPKTGKTTNRKKTIMVNAKDKEDALQAAEEAGIMPPYASVKFLDACPSEARYNYLHGAGIPIPYFVNTADASALLTRYEDRDNEICPGYLFEMATRYRAEVSYFQSPASVKSCIWAAQAREKKPAMFCYAVYCKKRGYDFGAAQTNYDDPIFAGFQPTEREKAYIEGIVEFGWIPLRTNTNAYKSAVAYLAEQRLI